MQELSLAPSLAAVDGRKRVSAQSLASRQDLTSGLLPASSISLISGELEIDAVTPSAGDERSGLSATGFDKAEASQKSQRRRIAGIDVGHDRREPVKVEGPVNDGTEGFFGETSTPDVRMEDEAKRRKPPHPDLADDPSLERDYEVFAVLRPDRHHLFQPGLGVAQIFVRRTIPIGHGVGTAEYGVKGIQIVGLSSAKQQSVCLKRRHLARIAVFS